MCWDRKARNKWILQARQFDLSVKIKNNYEFFQIDLNMRYQFVAPTILFYKSFKTITREV